MLREEHWLGMFEERDGYNCVMKRFVITVAEMGMGRACGTTEEEQECIQDTGGNPIKKETSRKTKT
jgi:hypothetical protein